jgi:hypothetical protein
VLGLICLFEFISYTNWHIEKDKLDSLSFEIIFSGLILWCESVTCGLRWNGIIGIELRWLLTLPHLSRSFGSSTSLRWRQWHNRCWFNKMREHKYEISFEVPIFVSSIILGHRLNCEDEEYYKFLLEGSNINRCYNLERSNIE